MKKIISFTTIPARINKIQKMVDSILNQTVKPDEVILWVGERYKRVNGENVEIPNFLKQSNIKVKFCEDIGPFTKLYYSLKEEWDEKETIIITVDDDVYYPPNWFANLIEYSIENPNSAIGYRGRTLNGDKLNYNNSTLFLGSPNGKPKKVDIITGTWGGLYKPKFFNEEIFNHSVINDNFFVDDIWITGNLANNNIDRIIIKNVGVEPLIGVSNIDSLWSLNKLSDNNNKMLKYFKGKI